jgi:FkbM family methyltransferase
MTRRSLARAWHAAGAQAREAVRTRGLELRRVPRVFVDHPDAELRLGLEQLIGHRMMTAGPDLFVVQVGAFDGRTNDPIHEWIKQFGWSGILVEPQARPFAQLQKTYADCPRLNLRNVAIAPTSGRRAFYSVRPDVAGVPDWVAQLSSFDRATILAHQHLVPGLDELIVTSDVACESFEDLLTGIDRVDLLQIDAEGYDAEIVRMFDFERWRPSIVHFESVHLEAADHESVMRHLVAHGYRLAEADADTLAYCAA